MEETAPTNRHSPAVGEVAELAAGSSPSTERGIERVDPRLHSNVPAPYGSYLAAGYRAGPLTGQRWAGPDPSTAVPLTARSASASSSQQECSEFLAGIRRLDV
jgi:hypothetical protein